MKKKNSLKRILAVALAALLIFTMLPLTAAEGAADLGYLPETVEAAEALPEDAAEQDEAGEEVDEAEPAAEIAPAYIGIMPLTNVSVGNFGQLESAIANYATATSDMTITVTAPIAMTADLSIPANPSGHTLTITGQQITRGVIGNLFHVNVDSTLILENIIIDGGSTGAFSDGGGALISVWGGTLVMNNGTTIRNNTLSAPHVGGGVFVSNNGTFIMNGGIINNNTVAASGGGVFVAAGSTFTMNSGTISDNTAFRGGGILAGGAFTMHGGAVSDNIANNSGGGVQGPLTLGGSSVINNNINTATGNANNVSLGNNQFITFATGANAPTAGMNIGVTKAGNNRIFVQSGATAANLSLFSSDITMFSVDYSNGQLRLLGTWGASFINLSDPYPPPSDAGWTFNNHIYTIQNGADVTVIGDNMGGQRRIEVAADAIASITLDNMTITMPGNNQSALLLNNNANVALYIVGTNTLTSGTFRAGIQVPNNTTLTIDGTGSLTAQGGNLSAGIGGFNLSGGGNITINSGTINAIGGVEGAGIGGGSGHTGGNITINDGTVTANGGNFGAGQAGGGAGIGGGHNGAGGIININGGTVTASGGANFAGVGGGAGIGGGNGPGGHGGNVTITGGTVTASGGGTGTAQAIGRGTNITASSGTLTINGTFNYRRNTTNIDPGGAGTDHTFAGVTTHFTGNRFVRLAELTPITNLTIGGVTAPAVGATPATTVTGGGTQWNATIAWFNNTTNAPAGANFTGGTVYRAEITISPQTGWTMIGVTNPGFTVAGATVTRSTNVVTAVFPATGTNIIDLSITNPPAVGIGWTFAGSVYTVTGTDPVTVTGSNAGSQRRVTVAENATATITLEDVTIGGLGANQTPVWLANNATATITLVGASTLEGGANVAGLGAGTGRTLTISGAGSLNTTGGFQGAGIGGGNDQGGGTINITGGIINATGGQHGAGLGSGRDAGGNSSTITISGGTVTAQGGQSSAGIGGGNNSPGGTVNISGGNVSAGGTGGGAGIGGGWQGAGGTITISGGTVQALAGNNSGFAIGRSQGATTETVNINGSFAYERNLDNSMVNPTTGFLTNTGTTTHFNNNSFVRLTYTTISPITTAAVTVTAPATGATPSGTATTSGTVNFTLSTVTWSPNNTPFTGGTQYTATVTLTAQPGHTFTGIAASSVTINGQAAQIVANNGNTLTLSRQFPSTADAPITSAAINITAPVTGQTRPLTATGTGNFAIGGVTWTPSTGTTFTGGTVYTAQVTLTADGGHTFTGIPAANVSINGQTAQIVGIPGATVTLSFEFPITHNVPGAPTIGTATAGNTTATVTFTAPVTDGGSTITGFTVTSSPGGITATGAGSPITVTGLINGTEYTFTVTATNAVGTGAPSVASNAVTPNAAGGSPEITSGNSAAFIVGTADSFTPAATNSPTSWAISGTLPVGVTFDTTTGAISGTPATSMVGIYNLTLTATNAAGPSAPQNFTLTVNPSGAFVAVTDITGVDTSDMTAGDTRPLSGTIVPSTATGQTIVWSIQSAGTTGATITGGNQLNTPNVGAVTVRATVANGTAVGTAWTQDFTINVEAPPTVPDAPQNLIAVPGNGQVALGWTAPASDGNSPILRYEVQVSGGTWTSVGNVLNHTVTGLTNGTAVTISVRAVNAEGPSTAVSETVTPVTVPTAPENFTATAGNGQVTLAWDAPTSDGGSAILRFEIQVGTGAWTDVLLASSHTVTGLANGTAVTFNIRAVNAVGNGAVASATATPTAPGGGWIPTPTPVITITTQPEDATVILGDIDSNLYVTATVTQGATRSYRWYCATDANRTGASTFTGATTATFSKPTDLTPGTHYFYVVISATGATSVRSDVAIVTVTLDGAGGFPFVDVPVGHWAREYVEFVWERDIMQGVSDTLFAPNTTLSRAMAATILWRMAGEPAASGSAVFTDVADGRWYTEAIAWANQNGIVLGVGDNRFSPATNVTREEFAAMMYRYTVFTGGNTSVPAGFDLSQFQDRNQLSGWAESYMYWANHNGLITGRTTTTLAPQGTATRAESAGIVTRFVAVFG